MKETGQMKQIPFNTFQALSIERDSLYNCIIQFYMELECRNDSARVVIFDEFFNFV